MSDTLTIAARIETKPEQVELVKAELLKLIPITLAEPGCLQYDLHQDNDNPAIFAFYENWTSRELWQQHMKNTHIAAYLQTTEGAVESFVLNEMTKL